jgi:arylformamidase
MEWKYTKMYDVTLPIKTGMVVYPNNPEVKLENIDGAHTYITKIEMGSHTGTHIDAPRHSFKDLPGTDTLDLDRFCGPCRVLDMTHVKEGIEVSDLEEHSIKEGERILVKTSNSERGWDTFYDDYIYLSGDAADYLRDKKISLFGIDYFSVKKRGGEDQRAHESLLGNEIAVVEGLKLDEVVEGEYIFLGLPLAFKEGDGSPIRAVLLSQ